MLQYEQNLQQTGCTLIAGIDEAGRGPLAGPVVVAGVIMPLDDIIEGINDSKKLSEKKREVFEAYFLSDLSLAEIAENTGITRQGVRDSIKRAEETLQGYEKKLGLADKLSRIEKKSEEAGSLLHSLKAKYPEAAADLDHVAELFGSISL